MVFSVLVLVEEVVVHELGKIAFVRRAANCAVGFMANFQVGRHGREVDISFVACDKFVTKILFWGSVFAH